MTEYIINTLVFLLHYKLFDTSSWTLELEQHERLVFI